MFTGIIETIGSVRSLVKGADSAVVTVDAHLSENDLKIGDSIALNGVCLTVTALDPAGFTADIGNETLKVTSLANLKSGSKVNLERPMKLGGRLGGHLVLGHVDDVGKVIKINKIATGLEVFIKVAAATSRYIIRKGSVAVNGVSLTTAEVESDSFKLFLIPHTVKSTTFADMKVGDEVNLEFDVIGKYIEKFAQLSTDSSRKEVITESFLKEHGF